MTEEIYLQSIIQKIWRSLELSNANASQLCQSAVTEIQQWLKVDQVVCYQIIADGSSEIIAESLHEDRLCSLQGLCFTPEDTSILLPNIFLQMGKSWVVDLDQEKAWWKRFVPTNQSQSILETSPLEKQQIYYYQALGIQKSVIIPLYCPLISSHHEQNKSLWGALVAYHGDNFALNSVQLQYLQWLGENIEKALWQILLITQKQQQKQQETMLKHIFFLLNSFKQIKLQTALNEICQFIESDGGRLSILPKGENQGKIYTFGLEIKSAETESMKIENHPYWTKYLKNAIKNKKPLLATENIYNSFDLVDLFPLFKMADIRGILTFPLYYRQKVLGFLTLFRKEKISEKNFGKFMIPQQSFPSFEIKKEVKAETSQPWTVAEIELTQIFTDYLANAIFEYNLSQQVANITNIHKQIEAQVNKRTQKLQKSLNWQNIIIKVTEQIRSSLDLETILHTFVQELRKFLQSDRVLIYQFLDEATGKVIVEDLNENISSVLNITQTDECFTQQYEQLQQPHYVRIINNINQADLTSCHRQFLESLNIKSSLVVPIKINAHLWGLLIVHQCHHIRTWLKEEIQLLQQISHQASVAIYQSKLYEQSCEAADIATETAFELQQVTDKLTQTLQDLKQAQTQLIQNEKLSSLGQLVAGVAHEINNPVNFIYGNIAHLEGYIKDVMELINIYEEAYPDPTDEVLDEIEEIDLEFLQQDLPKVVNSIKIGAERIRQLVLSLRNFSHKDQNEQKVVNLHEGIDSTLLILYHRLKAKAQQPEIQVFKNYGRLPEFKGFAGQLNQVFMNIFSNAIDAIEEKLIDEPKFEPQITVTTKFIKETNQILIELGDNAGGMPTAISEHIFEPFFTTKDVGKGTGLGLAITHQIIVEKHGGMIECESQEGKGTTFKIKLPC